jgi:hypothetical protein
MGDDIVERLRAWASGEDEARRFICDLAESMHKVGDLQWKDSLGENDDGGGAQGRTRPVARGRGG